MIKAVQINPAYQECLDLDFYLETISVFGNRHFIEHKLPVVEKVYDAVTSDDLAYELRNIGTGYSAYSTATEAINDMLSPEKAKYSTRDIHNIKGILADYTDDLLDEEDAIVSLLSIVTGEEWEYRSIRGCCQGDWNRAYYRKEDFPNGIDGFEVEYFNTGSEWLVDDEVSVYCHSWTEDGIAAEIADAYGCAAGDIELVHWN